MRSDSRLFLENPQQYKRAVVDAGTPADVADMAIRQGGTTLIQPVVSPATRNAQKGETGTLIAPDYLGQDTLQAYAPVVVKDSELHWSIVAKVDTAEAFDKEATFTKTMVLVTAGMIFGVCLLAILLAQIFVRPIRRLEEGAQRISAGDYDVAIPVTSRDEIGDLTVAFNEMGRSLTVKEDLINQQRRETDELLNSLMPETIAERFKQGEETIAVEHQNVTVIFADIIGLDRLQAELSPQDSLALVNELIRQIGRRRRRSRYGGRAHGAQRLPRQLWSDRAEAGQCPQDGRFRSGVSADHRPVQHRERQQSEPARRHRHRFGE